MPLYKVRFHRWNMATKPILEQETDVVFQTDAEKDSEEFEAAMHEALWEQNPMWLSPHGSRQIGFRGWSSVMRTADTLVIVERTEDDLRKADVTGDGNQLVPMTFHPMLPHDMRISLQSAYNRGHKDGKASVKKKK